MKIHEILDRDPRTGRLANNGQARILDPADEAAERELRAELETFVSDGQFGDALHRIIDRYLVNLGAPRQDSAWVSGFFGSGKSHLLKMLTHLWVNTKFRDGATARTLVRGGLPDDVQAALRELDTHITRSGKPPVAAAGSLLAGSVDYVRHTVLSVVLRACGWPASYPQAKFCFWLRRQGKLDQIQAAVEAAGRDWLKELNDLHVSPVIARALVDAIPGFAADEKSARQVLIQQFPQLRTDITTPEFVEAVRLALSSDRELPLTIIVLDEVQQYINEATDRASAITEVAEAVQTQLDSRVMLVGAGQSALSAGTQALMWLRDRFVISVELSDADVEAVTRKVLLQKKPSAVPTLESLFETHAGEVARHLQGTRLGQRGEDRRNRLTDYPLLPVRRRFWEACFQVVDAGGTHSQLRSQLRILHDSLHDIADRDLGAVIPASDLFQALSPSLVNSGFLLNELNTRIQKLDDGTDEGRLRRDLCGLAFFIGKFHREEGVDLGVRADASTLSDLLFGDVTGDSGPFRRKVSDALEKLVMEGTLARIETEFRLQTAEGAEWDRDFRERQTKLHQREPEVAARRDNLFAAVVQEALETVKVTHGRAKIRRTVALHLGNEAPTGGGDQVRVWLRDGWSCAQREVESEARRLGVDDPILHVHLPKKSVDELRERIIEAEAARQVLDHHGIPASDSGKEARAGMESRLRMAESKRDEIVRDLVRAARLYQGGGNEIFGDGLATKIEAGVKDSLARLYPRFDDGDHAGWEAAGKRAREGADLPLKVVGWDGLTEDHPVSKAVLNAIASGARGTEVEKALKAAPYGWPQDAIDAALIALHRSGHVRATRNGQPVAPGGLDLTGVKSAEFRPEKTRITTSERIALRGLFESVGVKTRSTEEEQRAPGFLDALRALAARAGGEPPCPAEPNTTEIDELSRLTGTEQLAAIHARRESLEKDIKSWAARARRAEERRPGWEMATALCRQASVLPVAGEVGPEIEAIRTQRSLLSEADHVSPLVARLADALRQSLGEKHVQLTGAIHAATTQLEADATWTRLDPADRVTILREAALDTPGPLAIATDRELREALDARPLAAWQDHLDAVNQRVANALQAAAHRLSTKDTTRKPSIVSVRRGTLSGEDDVRAWVQEHEKKLMEAASRGPVIVE